MLYAKNPYGWGLNDDCFLREKIESILKQKQQSEQQSWKNNIIDYEYKLGNSAAITGPTIQQMPTSPKKDVNGIISYFYSRKH